MLALAVFLSCPLERGGSQLERGARGYALPPLCGETHGGLERLNAGAERKSEREHTWGGWFLSPSFFSLTKVRLVFLGGPFRRRYICCRADRFSGGTLHWRRGKGSRLKMLPVQLPWTFGYRHRLPDIEDKMQACATKSITRSQWFKTTLNLNMYHDGVMVMRRDTTCSRSCSWLQSQGGSCSWQIGHNKLTLMPSLQTWWLVVRAILFATCVFKSWQVTSAPSDSIYLSQGAGRNEGESKKQGEIADRKLSDG